MNATVLGPVNELSSSLSSSSTVSPPSSDGIRAFEGAARTERELAHTLLSHSHTSTSSPTTALQTLSFTRPVIADSCLQGTATVLSAVEYCAPTYPHSHSGLVPSNRPASQGHFDAIPLDPRHNQSMLMQTLGSLRKVVRNRLCATITSTRRTIRGSTALPSAKTISATTTSTDTSVGTAATGVVAARPWSRYDVDFDSALSTASVALAAVGGCIIGDAVVRDYLVSASTGGQDAYSAFAVGVLRCVVPPIMGGIVGGAVMALPSGR